MGKYTELIKAKFSDMPISENKKTIGRINESMELIFQSNLKAMIKQFRKQTDQFCAYDMLFEFHIAEMILNSKSIKNPVYEVDGKNGKRIDFMFEIGNVSYEIELKRRWQTKNQKEKQLLINRLYSSVKRTDISMIFEYWASEDFKESDISPFFEYIEKNIRNFQLIDFQDTQAKWQYHWPEDKDGLVYFNCKTYEGIKPGIEFSHLPIGSPKCSAQYIDQECNKEAVKNTLQNAVVKFKNPPSMEHCNLIFLDISYDLCFFNSTMVSLMYGNSIPKCFFEGESNELIWNNDGVYSKPDFKIVSGVVIVASNLLSDDFDGFIFPNPKCIELMRDTRLPFDNMRIIVPKI